MNSFAEFTESLLSGDLFEKDEPLKGIRVLEVCLVSCEMPFR